AGITWSEHVVSNNFNGARSVFASDLDGDGDTDILGAASLDWAITWWENYDGSGSSWVEHFISSSINYAFAVHAYDVDQDGDTDVLGASYFGDDITVWENIDGSGLTWYEHLIDGNFDGASDVVTADMDGDGDPDILGVAREDADISWWDVTCCVGTGELVSSILDTEVSADWDSIVWTSDEPSGTSIYFQVRGSVDPQYMGDWSMDITTPGALEDYLDDGDRYVQYRVMLESANPGLSPTLWDIAIGWTELGINEEYGLKALPIAQFRNHPNPFSQKTMIEFNLPQKGDVTLTIFNILGEKVATLHSGEMLPGQHSFAWDASHLPSGVYMYRLETEGCVRARKMVLLR
ncbi:MAG: T9SS type A sorting domain-containing protein, partial [candidate division WOR-3 bacterium]